METPKKYSSTAGIWELTPIFRGKLVFTEDEHEHVVCVATTPTKTDPKHQCTKAEREAILGGGGLQTLTNQDAPQKSKRVQNTCWPLRSRWENS